MKNYAQHEANRWSCYFGFLANQGDQATDRPTVRQTDMRSRGRRTDKRPFHAANETNFALATVTNKHFWLDFCGNIWLVCLPIYLPRSLCPLLSLSLSVLSFRKRCVFHTPHYTLFGCIMKPYPFSPAKPNGNAIFLLHIAYSSLSLSSYLLMIK